jgi:hypothetical protein
MKEREVEDRQDRQDMKEREIRSGSRPMDFTISRSQKS